MKGLNKNKNSGVINDRYKYKQRYYMTGYM